MKYTFFSYNVYNIAAVNMESKKCYTKSNGYTYICLLNKKSYFTLKCGNYVSNFLCI